MPRRSSLSPRRRRVASPLLVPLIVPHGESRRGEGRLDFFRSAIRRRPSPRAASRSCPCASSNTSSLAGRRRPRSRSSLSASSRMGRRDAEAEAELQAIEAAYAAESGKRRHLPDWSKTPAPAPVRPRANPVPTAACASSPSWVLSPPTCQGADFVSICGEPEQREHAGAEGEYRSSGKPELGLNEEVGFSKHGSGHGGRDSQSRAKPAPTHSHRLVLPRGCRRPELPPVHESCSGARASN